MNSIFIHGMGLLGTSIALGLQKKGYRLYGSTKSEKDVQILKSLGFKDVFLYPSEAWKKVVPQCTGFILGVPIQGVYKILEELSRLPLKEDAWITDLASTKTELVQWLENKKLNIPFVGSHPMAGGDQGGPQNASEAMFKDATVYIIESSYLKSVYGEERYQHISEKVKDIWYELGGHPFMLSHEQHDKWAAYLSHGLHLVSCASSLLLQEIPEVFDVPSKPSGGSFRDMSRVSGSNPMLWEGIIESNSVEVKNYLQNLASLIEKWVAKLDKNQLDVKEIFEEASRIRKHLIEGD